MLNHHATRFLVILLLSLSASALFARPLLKDGDRVLIIGDNVTLYYYYSRVVEDYFALHYPGARINFYNTGWTDSALERLPRLQRDIASLHATAAIICFGMNDGGYAPLDEKHLADFKKGMTGLVDGLKKAGVKKVVLLTPNCVDPDSARLTELKKDNWTYNDTLAALCKEIEKIGAKKKAPVADCFNLMLDVQTRAKKDDPKFTFFPDGIHPYPSGHMVMAYALLKALGCTEQPSGLEIDAVKGKCHADRCTVNAVKITNADITFTRTDTSLPGGFYTDVAQLNRYLPIAETFDQYRFKVTGLQAPFWKLTVEGMTVGTFTNTELAAGINLATRPGPWQTLAKKVDDCTMGEEGQACQWWVYLAQYKPADGVKPAFEAYMQKVYAFIDSYQEKRIHAADARTWHWVLSAVKN